MSSSACLVRGWCICLLKSSFLQQKDTPICLLSNSKWIESFPIWIICTKQYTLDIVNTEHLQIGICQVKEELSLTRSGEEFSWGKCVATHCGIYTALLKLENVSVMTLSRSCTLRFCVCSVQCILFWKRYEMGIFGWWCLVHWRLGLMWLWLASGPVPALSSLPAV